MDVAGRKDCGGAGGRRRAVGHCGPAWRGARPTRRCRRGGPGSRGYITVEWQGGGAHIFNVENRDGTIIYLDGQSNHPDNVAAWDRIKKTAKVCRIVRTDDLTPRESGPNTIGVNEWVIPRDAKYLKAQAARAKKKAEKKAAEAAEKERYGSRSWKRRLVSPPGRSRRL